MAKAVRFYASLGFELDYGGEEADFTSFDLGSLKLNLIADERAANVTWWGRVIFWVADVDAFYDDVVALGLTPHAPPQDATWGERYFHLTAPDGHELSFATPLSRELPPSSRA
jgi:catechol 2,3-dioxygenase-like lactoylglutathione lyase family enzyme